MSNESEVGSETAVMVYATLSNAAKTDTTSLTEKKSATVPPPSLPGLKEESESSESEREEERDEKDDDADNEERRYQSDEESEKSSVAEEPVKPPPYRPAFPSPPPMPSVFSSPATVPPPLARQYDDAELLEKQSLLLDLQRLKMQGIALSKEWTLADRVEDLTFECRRHTLHLDEMSNVGMMKDGLRIVCTGIEMLNNRVGLLDLDGWSTEVCRDLDKHNTNLCKIYRKYWRRTQSSSPELDIATSMLASMGMYHFKKKMNSNIKSSFKKYNYKPKNAPPPPTSSIVDEDDDEEAPP
jgi:hypothetical protein